MTAEIAIMNKSAVALAADSAVTFGGEGRQKIFNTVNKLFTLSKYRPVGVMIFGSAEVMNVPWETIIKAYRSKLGKRSFGNLEGYTEDFFGFLERERTFFPASEQKGYFVSMVSAFFRFIRQQIEREVQDRLSKSGPGFSQGRRQDHGGEDRRALLRTQQAEEAPRIQRRIWKSLGAEVRQESG